jgi:sodium-dependent dicarboxylate transporter 2/3/5
LGLVAGPAAAAALYLGPVLSAERPLLNAMAAVAALMAIWWLTEALPLAATALAPLVLFPLFKIPPGNAIALEYASPIIFLFLGGFLLALAIEDSGVHRRIALLIIAAMGDNPRRLVLGFMIATAGLSMWLSNTATTMMMLPIAASVLAQADARASDPRRTRAFGAALMLAVAYSASIGGMGTLVGTPPNVSFLAIFRVYYPAQPPITFLGWMTLGVPFAALMLLAAWLLLTRVLHPVGGEPLLGGGQVVRAQLRELGPIAAPEVRMLLLFAATAALWILREPVRGVGWAPWLDLARLSDGTRLVDDGTVAMAAALLCFILPSGRDDGRPLLEWESTRRLPWGIVLLFGGGMALAEGLHATGLDQYLGERLAGQLAGLPRLAMAALVATGMTFLTELTSNLASVNMFLPILASTSNELDLPPLLLMIPATLAASCAFMLPVATPPNAIVYGSGRIRMADMLRAGLWLNLIGVALIVLLVCLVPGFS